MLAAFEGELLKLVQICSESYFVRVQESLIGHLLMQQRLRQTQTLFIGTTASELTIISVCNLSGQVLREQVGSKRREVIAADLAGFLPHPPGAAADGVKSAPFYANYCKIYPIITVGNNCISKT